MKNISLLGKILVISLIVIIIGCFAYKFYKDKQLGETIYENNNSKIIMYELQTHEYFSNGPTINKYIIDSEDELNKFYSIYSEKLDINKGYLKDNSIFIQVKQVGSSSVQMKLSSVSFDNNTINFIIDEKKPDIGTMDMSFWYFVAIIPNNKLDKLNLNNWNKPSEVLVTTEY